MNLVLEIYTKCIGLCLIASLSVSPKSEAISDLKVFNLSTGIVQLISLEEILLV